MEIMTAFTILPPSTYNLKITLTADTNISLPTSGTLATTGGSIANLAGGGANNIPYQTAAGVTAFATGITVSTGAIDTVKAATGAAVGGATPGAGGLAFPATAVAVADPNTLDDYEEGTWTPVATGWTNVGAVTATGTYVKVGRIVFFRCSVTAATSVSATLGVSSISISPFTQAAGLDTSGSMVNDTTLASFGSVVISNNTIYPQTTGVLAGGVVLISGFYLV